MPAMKIEFLLVKTFTRLTAWSAMAGTDLGTCFVWLKTSMKLLESRELNGRNLEFKILKNSFKSIFHDLMESESWKVLLLKILHWFKSKIAPFWFLFNCLNKMFLISQKDFAKEILDRFFIAVQNDFLLPYCISIQALPLFLCMRITHSGMIFNALFFIVIEFWDKACLRLNTEHRLMSKIFDTHLVYRNESLKIQRPRRWAAHNPRPWIKKLFWINE